MTRHAWWAVGLILAAVAATGRPPLVTGAAPASPPTTLSAAAPLTTAAAPPAAPTSAAPAPGATAPPEPVRITVWRMIQAGGAIGYLIVLLSFAATGLIVEHFLSIRRDRLVPQTLVHTVEGLLEGRQYEQARLLCEQDGSFLGRVVAAGLGQVGAMFGFFDMQSAMQEVSEREIGRLYRKLEYLSFISVTAPMLGLLGTVTGMIASFNQIAVTEGAAKPSQLATGIWEALVTTVEGLVVAIPTMFFVSFFRNRIDTFVAEAETVVEKTMARFRKPHE